MTRRAHYTAKQLTYAVLRDLAVDIRCAMRDGLTDYAAKCREDFRKLWRARHECKIGRYGWPVQP